MWPGSAFTTVAHGGLASPFVKGVDPSVKDAAPFVKNAVPCVKGTYSPGLCVKGAPPPGPPLPRKGLSDACTSVREADKSCGCEFELLLVSICRGTYWHICSLIVSVDTGLDAATHLSNIPSKTQTRWCPRLLSVHHARVAHMIPLVPLAYSTMRSSARIPEFPKALYTYRHTHAHTRGPSVRVKCESQVCESSSRVVKCESQV
jgi:hypothetical protein